MAENVEITMSLKEAQVWTALQKLVDQQKKTEDGFGKAAGAGKKFKDEAVKAKEELEKFAASVNKVHASPLEKLTAEAKRLKTALDADLISKQKFDAAMNKAQADFDRDDSAEQERLKALEAEQAAYDKLQDEIKQADAELARFAERTKQLNSTPLERYQQQMARLNAALAAGKLKEDEFARAADRAQKELDEESQAAARAANATQRLGDTNSKAFGDDKLAAMGRMVVQVFSVQKALQLARQASDEYTASAEKFKQFSLSLAGNQENALKNLSGLPTAEKEDLLNKAIPELQKQTGFGDQGKMIDAFADAYSAGGSVPNAMKAVGAAAKITRNTPEQLQTYSGAAIDIMRSAQVDDAEGALGFLLQTGAISRVNDPEKLARNVPSVVAAAGNNAKGDNDQEAAKVAASVYGVLSKEAADSKGEMSATASIQLLEQVREFFEKDKHGPDPGSPLSRITTLQQNAALRDEFLKDLHGEAKAKPGMENLVTGGTAAAKEFQENIPNLSFTRKEFEALEKETRTATPQLKMGTDQNQANAASQNFHLSAAGKLRALDGQAWEIRNKALEETDLGFMDTANRWVGSRVERPLHYMAGTSQVDTALYELEGRAYKYSDGNRESDLKAAEERGDETSAAVYREQLQYLKEQIALLKQLKAEMSKVADETKANRPPKQSKPSPAPITPRK